MNHAEAMILSLVVEAKAIEAELHVMNLHDRQKIENYATGLYAEQAYAPLIARLHQIPGDIRNHAERL